MHTSSLSTSLLALSLSLNLSFALARPWTYDSEPCLPTLISFLAPRYMSVLGVRHQNCPQNTAHDREDRRDGVPDLGQPSLFRRALDVASDYYQHLPTIPIDRPRFEEGELYGREDEMASQELHEEQEHETDRRARKQRRNASPMQHEQNSKRRLEGRPHDPMVQGAEQEGTREASDADTESYLRSIINSIEAIPHVGLPDLSKIKLSTLGLPPTDAPSSEVVSDVQREAEGYQDDQPVVSLAVSQPFTRPQHSNAQPRPCTGRLDVARGTRHTWHSISHSVKATINGVDENIAAAAAIAVGIVVLVLLAVETLVAGRRGELDSAAPDEEKPEPEVVTRGRTMARRQRGRAWWMYTHR